MLALTWRDVDLRGGSVTINKSLEQTKKGGLRVKEAKGRNTRKLKLPPDAIAALERVKVSQEQARTMYAADYRADLDLVFCHRDGNFLRPDTVTKAVRGIAKKAGFSGVSLHTLRHSHGSQLLSEGVPLPVVSKRLGHTNVYVTATVYAHVLEGDESAAAEKWDIAMKRAANAKIIEMPLKKARG